MLPSMLRSAWSRPPADRNGWREATSEAPGANLHLDTLDGAAQRQLTVQ